MYFPFKLNIKKFNLFLARNFFSMLRRTFRIFSSFTVPSAYDFPQALLSPPPEVREKAAGYVNQSWGLPRVGKSLAGFRPGNVLPERVAFSRKIDGDRSSVRFVLRPGDKEGGMLSSLFGSISGRSAGGAREQLGRGLLSLEPRADRIAYITQGGGLFGTQEQVAEAKLSDVRFILVRDPPDLGSAPSSFRPMGSSSKGCRGTELVIKRKKQDSAVAVPGASSEQHEQQEQDEELARIQVASAASGESSLSNLFVFEMFLTSLNLPVEVYPTLDLSQKQNATQWKIQRISRFVQLHRHFLSLVVNKSELGWQSNDSAEGVAQRVTQLVDDYHEFLEGRNRQFLLKDHELQCKAEQESKATGGAADSAAEIELDVSVSPNRIASSLFDHSPEAMREKMTCGKRTEAAERERQAALLTAAKLGMPSLGMAFVRHVHRLAPRRYQLDMKRLRDAGAAPRGDKERLVSMTLRQLQTAAKFLHYFGDSARDSETRLGFVREYCQFLETYKRSETAAAGEQQQETRLLTPLVPSLVQDLVWHSHMQFPSFYRQDTQHFCGRLLNHSDEVDTRGALFDRWREETVKVYKKVWNVPPPWDGREKQQPPQMAKTSTPTTTATVMTTTAAAAAAATGGNRIPAACSDFSFADLSAIQSGILHFEADERMRYPRESGNCCAGDGCGECSTTSHHSREESEQHVIQQESTAAEEAAVAEDESQSDGNAAAAPGSSTNDSTTTATNSSSNDSWFSWDSSSDGDSGGANCSGGCGGCGGD